MFMKSYIIEMMNGARLSILAQGTAQALRIATAAGWMPWDVKHIEERQCGS